MRSMSGICYCPSMTMKISNACNCCCRISFFNNNTLLITYCYIMSTCYSHRSSWHRGLARGRSQCEQQNRAGLTSYGGGGERITEERTIINRLRSPGGGLIRHTFLDIRHKHTEWIADDASFRGRWVSDRPHLPAHNWIFLKYMTTLNGL